MKIKRNRIHTKTLMRWWRPIVKNVPQMRTAPGAQHFGSMHAERIIVAVKNTVSARRLKKTGPAAGACKFGVGPEKFIATYGAIISAFLIFVPVFARDSRLGGRFTRYGILFGRKNFFPLSI
jgi:hypothetical protein